MIGAVLESPSQPTLFGGGEPAVLRGAWPSRHDLADGAWVEHIPGWVAGEQTLFDHLVASTEWHAHRRPMYDRMVDVPRLTASLPRDGAGHPLLGDVVAALAEQYGESMHRIGLALYRNGADSVAPHGDQVARHLQTTTMATVSLGARRRFHLSRVGGSGTLDFDLGHGDLLVMGGTIQRTWRHGIPKTNRAVGPRLCVMFRGAGLD